MFQLLLIRIFSLYLEHLENLSLVGISREIIKIKEIKLESKLGLIIWSTHNTVLRESREHRKQRKEKVIILVKIDNHPLLYQDSILLKFLDNVKIFQVEMRWL